MSSWWNDRGYVGLGHGSRAPVDCARLRLSYRRDRLPWLGVPVAHRLARRLHVSLGRDGSRPRRSSALMMSRGFRRSGKMSPEVSISPETSPQGSGEMEFVVRVASDWHVVRAFGGSGLLGPLRWGFSDRAGWRILPSVGYPSILIPNSSPEPMGEWSTPS
jgi:hypothetical protein